MPDLTGATWSTPALALAVAAATVAIGVVGPRLAGVAHVLASRTGLGQAITGGLLLGAATSLSGLVTSVTAAVDGRTQLAIANAVGGIATQTLFLALADLYYKRANLEHAAASLTNVFQCVLLTGLLGLVVLAALSPDVALGGVHPVTPLLFAAYLFGMRVALGVHREPMWRVERTSATQTEDGAHDGERDPRSTTVLWLTLAMDALLIGLSGWLLARGAGELADRGGLDQTLVGGLFTAFATSLPELVTVIAAIRRGAVNLAVGDIVGGNVFDTLFVGAADLAYRDGSIYHVLGPRPMFVLALTIVLTAVLALGMLRREPSGFANIGFESTLILVLYAAGFLTLGLW